MKITFFGGPFRQESICYGSFDALEELIQAGYVILNVEGA